MPKARMRAATVGGSADEVEALFYEALRQGNVEQLMACWADDDEICCVHPNGERLIGAAAIRAGFERLLVQGGLPLEVEDVHRVDAVGAAIHNVLERLGSADVPGLTVVATNVYHKTAQGWRMVVHHATQGSVRPQRTGAPATVVLH